MIGCDPVAVPDAEFDVLEAVSLPEDPVAEMKYGAVPEEHDPPAMGAMVIEVR